MIPPKECVHRNAMSLIWKLRIEANTSNDPFQLCRVHIVLFFVLTFCGLSAQLKFLVDAKFSDSPELLAERRYFGSERNQFNEIMLILILHEMLSFSRTPFIESSVHNIYISV